MPGRGKLIIAQGKQIVKHFFQVFENFFSHLNWLETLPPRVTALLIYHLLPAKSSIFLQKFHVFFKQIHDT